MEVFLTGATGFIGRRLTQLLVATGHHVSGMSRSPEGVQELRELGAHGIVADLREPAAALATSLRSIAPEAVVHLAAETATQRSSRRIWAVDVEGTRRLLSACARAAVPRIVLAGTVVVGNADGATLREDARLHPTTAYGRAKLEAERLLFEHAASRGVDATVIRPSHVYGPGGWFASVVRDLRRGRFFLPGRGDNWWHLIHVDDVASAFARTLLAPESSRGEIFHVVDDEPLTMRAFFDATAALLGVAPPRSVPPWLAALVAGRGPVAAAVRSARSSNEKIKTRLGWQPAHPRALAALPGVLRELAAL